MGKYRLRLRPGAARRRNISFGEIPKLKNEGTGDIWLEAGDFPLPDERPAHFSRSFLTSRAAGGPGGSQRGQVEMEIGTQKRCARDPSVSTTESLVWTLVPIGNEPTSAWTFYSTFRRHNLAPNRDAQVPRAF